MAETKEKKLRMIWSTNTPWCPSGYGVHMKDLLFRFVEAGYPTACSLFYGLEGGVINISGLTCYPKMGQTYGGDALFWHQMHFNAHVAFTFQDVWPIEPQPFLKCKNWIAYVPIDMDPAPQPVIDKLKNAYRIIALCEFGRKTLEKAGLVAMTIPEGIDTKIFRPMDRTECRKALAIPEDIYLFGMIAANKDNPPRKCFQQSMDAFAKFKENHKDIRTGIYFQTLLQQEGGFDIQGYAEHLGIANDVFYPQPYVMMYHTPRERISQIINSFNVLLSPSQNEGFGLPIVEAQGCGVPVITTNWTAMPEHIIPGKTGELVDVFQKRWTPLNGYVAVPDVNSIYDKMETVFRYDREQTAKDCRDNILKNYDIDKIFVEKWLPLLEEVEKEVVK